MVKVQTAPPHQALRPFVYRYVQRNLAPNAGLNEPVVARLGGCLEFQFAGLFRIPLVGSDRHDHCPRIGVIGPMTHHTVDLHADGAVESLTVFFHPEGFRELFGTPMHLIAGHGFEATPLIGGCVDALYQRLGNAPGFPERVQMLEEFLLRRHRPAASGQLSKAMAWSARVQEPRAVGAIANATGMSVRRLERKSLEYFCVSPQMATRIARFQRALFLHRTGPATWTEIAYATGYYDQMHMIRDFRTFAGMTPTELALLLRPYHAAGMKPYGVDRAIQ
jgi:AraC-like DNA-binding protein